MVWKKNCHLSIHLQETGVQKNQKWILAATQKRTRKWPCSWVSHVWAEVKINFSHFHPHRVIESTRKAEGKQGQDPGEKIGSSETCQVRRLLENLREGFYGCTETRLWNPHLVFSLTASPIYFCTFEMTHAKFPLLPWIYTSLLTPVHFWSKSKAVCNKIFE